MKAVTRLRWEAPRPRTPAIDVLVYCDVCERFIAHEDDHHCNMPVQKRAARRVARLRKNKEIGNE